MNIGLIHFRLELLIGPTRVANSFEYETKLSRGPKIRLDIRTDKQFILGQL